MTVYEVVLEGRQGTEDMLTVLHYDVTGETPPNFTAMADVFRVQLLENIAPLCPSTVTWLGLTIRLDIPGSVGTFIPFTLGVLAGSAVDGELMRQSAMLVTKRTGTLVRPTQGRIFQGGIQVRALNANGTWEVAFRTAVDAFWEAVRVVDFSGPSAAQMLVKASNPTAPNTVAYNDVAELTVSDIPVTQRRRKIGSGA